MKLSKVLTLTAFLTTTLLGPSGFSAGSAPVAQNQSYSTPAGSSKLITLAGTDAEGDPLTYQITLMPQASQGTLIAVNPTDPRNPNYIFTPVAGFTGISTFRYRVDDGGGLFTPAATVTITVTALPPPPVVPPTVTATPPELPRVFINTTYVAPTGRQISVAVGGDFQAALNSAACGDEILLPQNATYTGNFRLPTRACANNPIHIRTNIDMSLIPEGIRIRPDTKNYNFAKLLTSNNDGALKADKSARGYRIMALEIGVAMTPGVVFQSDGMVKIGEGDGSYANLAELPGYVTFDRVYIHAPYGNAHIARCLAMNGVSTAVVDSWLSGCHAGGRDAQAVAGWSGSGPFKIVNNYLEASGENIIFGGSDSSGFRPSDIEIRGNYMFKPTKWRDEQALNGFSVKNLFELKDAERVLVEGNVMENNWYQSQAGRAIVIQSMTGRAGQTNVALVQDITIRNNIIKASGSGFDVLAEYYLSNANYVPVTPPLEPTSRLLLKNNLFTEIGQGAMFPEGMLAMILSGTRGLRDVVLDHNSFICSKTPGSNCQTAIEFGGFRTPDPTDNPEATVKLNQNLVVANNLFDKTTYGPRCSASTIGGEDCIKEQSITYSYVGNAFAGNPLIVGSDIDSSGRLNSGSPYKNTATDGKDPGADIAAILAATSGTISGDWSGSAPYVPPIPSAPPAAPTPPPAPVVPPVTPAPEPYVPPIPSVPPAAPAPPPAPVVPPVAPAPAPVPPPVLTPPPGGNVTLTVSGNLASKWAVQAIPSNIPNIVAITWNVDGAWKGDEYNAPYCLFGDPGGLPCTLGALGKPGQHTITAKVINTSGVKVSEASITVTEGGVTTPPPSAPTTPGAPSNLSVSLSGTTAKLAWTPGVNTMGYNLYRNDVYFGSVATPTATNLVTPGNTYRYKVIAYNSQMVPSASSNEVTLTVPGGVPTPPTTPGAPSNLSVSLSGTTAKLSWTGGANTMGYNLYRNDVYFGSVATPTATNLVTPGNTYRYKVIAYNSQMVPSASSNEATLTVPGGVPTPPTTPGAPSNLSVSLSGTTAKLAWTPGVNTMGYNLYRNDVYFGSVATPTATNLVTPGNTYRYKVIAYNTQFVPSSSSNEVTVVS